MKVGDLIDNLTADDSILVHNFRKAQQAMNRFAGQPDHCTRRRLKPFIDGCGCEWCEKIDGEYEAQMRIYGDGIPTGPLVVWNGNRGKGPRNAQPAKRLIDANGLEWHDVTWCNTETGELEYYIRENGEFLVEGGEIRAELVQTAAPLRIEW